MRFPRMRPTPSAGFAAGPSTVGAAMAVFALCCMGAAAAPHGPAAGLYVGSSGGPGCRSGWLLRIGPGDKSALYVSPYLLHGQVEIASSGKVTLLRAESPDGSRYTVAQGAGGSAKNVVVTVEYDRNRTRRFKVAFQRATGPGSVYSDVRRLPATGDLIGSELALARVGRRLVGVFTRFQGEAGPHLAVSGPAAGPRPVLAARGCRAAMIVVTHRFARIGKEALPLRGTLAHWMAAGSSRAAVPASLGGAR